MFFSEEAWATIDVIGKFHNLFDVLNSSLKSCSNVWKNVFVRQKNRLEFLENMTATSEYNIKNKIHKLLFDYY